MAFFVYVGILLVAISGILLELDWLTKPKLDARSPLQAAQSVLPSSPPARPKPEVAGDRLNPVYPKKPEVARVIEPPSQQQAETTGNATPQEEAPAQTAQAPQPSAPPVPQPVATAKAEPTPQPPQPAQPVQPPPPSPAANAPPPPASERTASVTPQSAAVPSATSVSSTAVSPNKCDVDACAAAYSSFRASDCTYQPFAGSRRVCEKPPTRTTAHRRSGDEEVQTASRRGDDEGQGVSHRRGKADELREVEVTVRRIRPADGYDDDDGEDVPARGNRRVIVIERPANRGWFW